MYHRNKFVETILYFCVQYSTKFAAIYATILRALYKSSLL